VFSVEELKQWPERLFSLQDADFEALAIKVFRYQATYNEVYSKYVQLRNVDIEKVERLYQIPFLPIELFKSHIVITGHATPELVFESSRTTGQISSQHVVLDAGLYHKIYFEGFKRVFGTVKDHCILALLPSYLERGNSSLVYMAQGLMKESGHPDNGFYLDNLVELTTAIKGLLNAGTPTLLLGVSFALLDMAEEFVLPLGHIKVMETGGMKGRRRELLREQLHDILKSAFQLPHIYSEYGMTELLSQAYTDGSEWFAPPTWMRVLARDAYDPLDTYATPASGGLNVIDLGNIHSCAFIATSDLTAIHSDGRRFKVLGRMDISETRGCNLMVG
jgi:hypothetical protein